jgi:hypothetical protein
MQEWLTVVEGHADAYYLVFRQPADGAEEWYVAVLEYPVTFRPAPSSVTAPPEGIDWVGPFPSREAARAAAARAITHGCVTPSSDLKVAA